MATSQLNNAIEIGVVVKPHGVRGLIKIRLHNPESHAMSQIDLVSLLVGDDTTPTIYRNLLYHGATRDFHIVEVPGITDCDRADALRGARVFLDRTGVVLDEGEYLYADLIGCTVIEGERVYGHVIQCFSSGASDILVVRHEKTERMIPFIDPWIAGVDLSKRAIEIVDGEQWESYEADD